MRGSLLQSDCAGTFFSQLDALEASNYVKVLMHGRLINPELPFLGPDGEVEHVPGLVPAVSATPPASAPAPPAVVARSLSGMTPASLDAIAAVVGAGGGGSSNGGGGGGGNGPIVGLLEAIEAAERSAAAGGSSNGVGSGGGGGAGALPPKKPQRSRPQSIAIPKEDALQNAGPLSASAPHGGMNGCAAALCTCVAGNMQVVREYVHSRHFVVPL